MGIRCLREIPSEGDAAARYEAELYVERRILQAGKTLPPASPADGKPPAAAPGRRRG